MKKINILLGCGVLAGVLMVGCNETAQQPVGTTWSFDASEGPVTIVFDDQGLKEVVTGKKAYQAMMTHDASAMLNAAQAMADYEKKSGKIDQQWNSDACYYYSALYAAGQNNKAVLTQCVATQPSLKPLVSYTVVTAGNASLPQLVEVKDVQELSKLTKDQQPIWGDYAAAFFPEMPKAEFKIVCNKINSARSILLSDLVAETALELVKYETPATPAGFKAEDVFNSAIEMAIFMHDKIALQKIYALYQKAPFAKTERLRELKSELAGKGATRGWRGGFDEEKLRKLHCTEVVNTDGTVSGYAADGCAGIRTTGRTSGRHYTGRDALAHKVNMFYRGE